jgi:putative transcriptional regulator
MVLAEFDDVDKAAAPIFDRVGFMPADAEPVELAISRMRLFAGYAGWGAGQLEAELEEPSWIVVDAEADDAFADDPDELWRRVLHRKGGPFELMIDMPFDPGLN